MNASPDFISTLEFETWLKNNLLDATFLSQKACELVKQPIPYDLAAWLPQHFNVDALSQRNEAQLEKDFIYPLLARLGWFAVNQETITVQGKQAKPDWCLVLDQKAQEALLNSKDSSHIAAICEAKAWDKVLDTGKASREKNPHHQLQDYLSTLRVRYGFLTNGRLWRIYDTDKITAKKTFIEFDLAALLSLENGEEKNKGFALFAFFFGQASYVKETTEQKHQIQRIIAESNDFTLAVEENLKAVIYGYAGEESIFETIGRGVHRANPRAKLEAVYENTVIFLFRLLFIVYFEDKNRELLQQHPFYLRYSLGQLFLRLRQQITDKPDCADYYDALFELRHIFAMLDTGAGDIDIPLFNGGLFEPERAPLLKTKKLFNNQTLFNILAKLFYKTHRGETLFNTRRDFKNMSVAHLGRIYEGLLEFRFEKAIEDSVYLEYQSSSSKNQTIEAYFDQYDASKLRKEKGFKALREFAVAKGEFYLKSANNSRKSSASYYTPSSLSLPLVAAGINKAVSTKKNLFKIRILDNACGSGHFLVEALGYLTDVVLARLDQDQELRQSVLDEREKIKEQLAEFGLSYALDEAKVVKRLLLKHCIFGVDLNLFAIELARLSLWMDSFIFGTPLSFIEHHIQHGNALIGASIADFINYNHTEAAQGDLLVGDLSEKFNELHEVITQLDAMHDTTAEEIAQSKFLWKNEIQPKIKALRPALDFLCTRRILAAAGDQQGCQRLDKTPDLVKVLFDSGKQNAALMKQITEAATTHHFFHYELAFPEAFFGEDKGFDVIMGNPPWDKTKFSDTDFFPQFHSNYRSLKNNEKEAVQERLLGSKWIKERYDHVKHSMALYNNYYKNNFPLSRGAGDGNLFRFFVERNLGLLNQAGCLNYVLPSALMFEDGSSQLREHIFSQCTMTFFYSFENREALFLDVHRSYKFAMMQIVNHPNPEGAEAKIDSAFYLTQPKQLQQTETHISYPLSVIRAMSPGQSAMMELRQANDLPILQKCYAALPRLSPDWLDFRNEFHMTNDKSLFLEQKADGLLPLYEGKMIWQYSHQLQAANYWLDPVQFDARLQSKELHRMAQDLGISKKDAEKYGAAITYDRKFIRLAFREVASDTNERSLILALLPKNCGYGHTLFANEVKRYVFENGEVTTTIVSPLRLLFALAWLNSVVSDWLIRFMIQIHISKTYLYRLPMPQPSDAEILADEDFSTLAKNALLLSLATNWEDFAELAPLFKVQQKDVPKTDKAKDKLRAENDQIIAQRYGLTTTELQHILRSFKVMADKRPEYLTLFS